MHVRAHDQWVRTMGYRALQGVCVCDGAYDGLAPLAGAVEDRAVQQRARVVHPDRLPRRWFGQLRAAPEHALSLRTGWHIQ